MVHEKIWRCNAHLGEIERMWRISHHKQIEIPFTHLERAVVSLMLILLKARNVSRSLHDKRTNTRLVYELAIAFVIIGHAHYNSPLAWRLRNDMYDFLTLKGARWEIVRALNLVSPSEEIVTDSEITEQNAILEPVEPFTILHSNSSN
ncbi:MAG: hypothetical protein AAB337_01710 [Patescibacteria group bacterium]